MYEFLQDLYFTIFEMGRPGISAFAFEPGFYCESASTPSFIIILDA